MLLRETIGLPRVHGSIYRMFVIFVQIRCDGAHDCVVIVQKIFGNSTNDQGQRVMHISVSNRAIHKDALDPCCIRTITSFGVAEMLLQAIMSLDVLFFTKRTVQ